MNRWASMFNDELIAMAPRASMEVIKTLNEQISLFEKTLKAKAKLRH